MRSLVIGAENYYGARPKTIVLKFVFFPIESDPDRLRG